MYKIHIYIFLSIDALNIHQKDIQNLNGHAIYLLSITKRNRFIAREFTPSLRMEKLYSKAHEIYRAKGQLTSYTR